MLTGNNTAKRRQVMNSGSARPVMIDKINQLADAGKEGEFGGGRRATILVEVVHGTLPMLMGIHPLLSVVFFL